MHPATQPDTTVSSTFERLAKLQAKGWPGSSSIHPGGRYAGSGLSPTQIRQKINKRHARNAENKRAKAAENSGR